MNIMVFTDNKFMYEKLVKIIELRELDKENIFTYACSKNNALFEKSIEVKKINIKDNVEEIILNYNLVISCHSKQIFPNKLIHSLRCINIHPGYNPYNRGWYPQVFSILNNHPLGVTIHEMDEEIDHGDIIVQKELTSYSWDTSLTLYNRILELEVELLNENIEFLIQGTYKTFPMHGEGNYNSKQDYNKLCELDLTKKATTKDVIDQLRALTHGNFNNAYFIDKHGDKIFVKIILEKEETTYES